MLASQPPGRRFPTSICSGRCLTNHPPTWYEGWSPDHQEGFLFRDHYIHIEYIVHSVYMCVCVHIYIYTNVISYESNRECNKSLSLHGIEPYPLQINLVLWRTWRRGNAARWSKARWHRRRPDPEALTGLEPLGMLCLFWSNKRWFCSTQPSWYGSYVVT